MQPVASSVFKRNGKLRLIVGSSKVPATLELFFLGPVRTGVSILTVSKSENGIGCFPLTHHLGKIMRPVSEFQNEPPGKMSSRPVSEFNHMSWCNQAEPVTYLSTCGACPVRSLPQLGASLTNVTSSHPVKPKLMVVVGKHLHFCLLWFSG